MADKANGGKFITSNFKGSSKLNGKTNIDSALESDGFSEKGHKFPLMNEHILYFDHIMKS